MQANTRKRGREDANQMLLNASCKSSGSDPKLGSDETQKPDSSRAKLPGTWGPGPSFYSVRETAGLGGRMQ